MKLICAICKEECFPETHDIGVHSRYPIIVQLSSCCEGELLNEKFKNATEEEIKDFEFQQRR